MSINRIQKLLFSEYCDFEDVVLVESPFAETTREGRGIRQIHIGLTPSKLIIARDVMPSAMMCNTNFVPGTDPEIETFELISVYPIECVNLSVFHRRKRQAIKARFCNNKIRYFELGGFEKRCMFWNLWCEKLKFLNPNDPNTSQSETSVATSTTNSTLYLVSSQKFMNQKGTSQFWCKYASGDFIRNPPPKWPDKYLYLGKNLEESPLKYTPCQNQLTIEQFIKRNKHKKINRFTVRNLFEERKPIALINRFSSGVKENCSTGLFLEFKGRHDMDYVTKNLEYCGNSQEPLVSYHEMAEDAVRMWEFHRTTSSALSIKNRHRRRYGFLPHPHFFYGFGPWNVNQGEKYTLQIKRSPSMVTIKRQPLEAELRLTVSKRQLVATISCDNLKFDDKIKIAYNNTIRLPPRRPVIFFWTPEYWYRPRSAKDAYLELQFHLRKIRENQQIKESNRTKCKIEIHKNNSSSSECVENIKKPIKKSKISNALKLFSKKVSKIPPKDDCESTSYAVQEEKETSLQYLKRILKINVVLTAWDFDSDTLAFQLTLIDKELFLKITPAELGVLIFQQSSKNAPNLGAFVAFSHRISCLVATEILKDESKKLRARLVARFINAADKCNQICNFQSCRSVLCGLQSPSIYRLYDTWTYLRKRHSSKYEVFEKLCRIYRDPRLLSYQKYFYNSSKSTKYIPHVGDMIARLINKIPEYSKDFSDPLGIKISVKSKKDQLPPASSNLKKEDSSSVLKKILSSFGVYQEIEKKQVQLPKYKEEASEIIRLKCLNDHYKPINCFEDNREKCLNDCIEFLEKSQLAASHYDFKKHDLAREYLLKARYREDKENFYYSFHIEPLLQYDTN